VMATANRVSFMNDWQLVQVEPDKIVTGSTLRMFQQHGATLRPLSPAERRAWDDAKRLRHNREDEHMGAIIQE